VDAALPSIAVDVYQTTISQKSWQEVIEFGRFWADAPDIELQGQPTPSTVRLMGKVA
jgi:hypothetical protein